MKNRLLNAALIYALIATLVVVPQVLNTIGLSTRACRSRL